MARIKKFIGAGPNGVASLKKADGTPLQLVNVSDVSESRTYTTKDLPSNDSVYPEDVMVTDVKQEVTLKTTAMYARLFAALINGTVVVGGERTTKETPTLTNHVCTVAHAAAFLEDLGLVFQDGTPGKWVSGAPAAADEYSVTAGAYTLHSSVTVAPEISYGYTDPTMVSVEEGDSAPGQPTLLGLTASMNYLGKQQTVRYHALRPTKVSESAKTKDHGSWDVTLEVQKDPTTGKAITTSMDV